MSPNVSKTSPKCLNWDIFSLQATHQSLIPSVLPDYEASGKESSRSLLKGLVMYFFYGNEMLTVPLVLLLLLGQLACYTNGKIWKAHKIGVSSASALSIWAKTQHICVFLQFWKKNPIRFGVGTIIILLHLKIIFKTHDHAQIPLKTLKSTVVSTL